MTVQDCKAIIIGLLAAMLILAFVNYDAKPGVEPVVLPVDLSVELPITFDEWTLTPTMVFNRGY